MAEVVMAIVGSTATTGSFIGSFQDTLIIVWTIVSCIDLWGRQDKCMQVLLDAFVLYTSRRRPGPIFNKYGPLVLVMYAVPLIMLDPLRHIMLDHKIINSADWSMYLDNDCDNDSLSAIKCLSLKGWLITIGSTYLGFFFLVIGSFWNANIMEKLREIRTKWRELRDSRNN